MGKQRKRQNRRPHQEHAGGPSRPVSGVEPSASGPPKVHTENTETVSWMRITAEPVSSLSPSPVFRSGVLRIDNDAKPNVRCETGPTPPPQRQRQTARYSGPPRGGQRQTARYSGPPRGGAHVARCPAGSAHPGVACSTGSPETALDAENASDSGSAAAAIANFTPYLETLSMASAVCSFMYMRLWDPSQLMLSGVEQVTTGPWFETRNAHLQIITTLPTLCTSLTKVYIQNAGLLTDCGIIDLVTSCPNLKVLSFTGATKLTCVSFTEIVEKLQELEMLGITGRTNIISCYTACPAGSLKTRETLGLLHRRLVAPKLRSLVLTGHDEISFAVGRKLTAKRGGLEIILGSRGPLYCTFWKGELVRVEENPAYKYINHDDDDDDDESGGVSDDEGQEWDSEFTSEDHTYDCLFSAHYTEGAYLDATTGILMPANGLYWEPK